jgi:hypothetical protein
MKTVVIDGVEYEEVKREKSWRENTQYIAYRTLPPKPKTIVQVAADVMGYTADRYSATYEVAAAAYDYIEQRLQAIERKLEGK